MLLELCCRCGFVHKDDRILLGEKPYRGYKPHYHWTPLDGELLLEDLRVHATICVACCSDPIDWNEFFEQKAKTPERYQVKGSLNAPLPQQFLEYANELYTLQVKHFKDYF